MKLLKTTLLIFIAFSTFSQKNYTKGFIILKNQTDTLKGLIDDQNWAINPRTINFKTAEDREQTYEIGQLSAFGVPEKESYMVAKADLDVNPVAKKDLFYGRNLQIKKDTLLAFLVLLKADYSLLYLKDKTDKTHFFYKEGEEIIELVNHFFLEARGGRPYEFNNKFYQKQLEVLFNQCTKKISTDRIEFQIDELTEKFVEFSECIGCNYTCYIKKEKDSPVFTFGIMAGASSDRNSFSHYSVFEGISFVTKTAAPSGMVGINASISSRRNLNRNSVLLESFITRERVKNEPYNFSTSIQYLSLSLRFRHQFVSMHKINPFVGGGLNAKFFMSYPLEAEIYGAKLNLYYAAEAGLKWNNFLLSANLKLRTINRRPGGTEDLLIRYYDGDNTIRQVIKPEKINFHLSLTYLLFNSANKAKTKK